MSGRDATPWVARHAVEVTPDTRDAMRRLDERAAQLRPKLEGPAEAPADMGALTYEQPPCATHAEAAAPDVEPASLPTRRYGAICPHSGGLPAEEFETAAPSLRAAYDAFWRMCVGSRYVSRIYEQTGDAWTLVWREGQALPPRKETA